MKFTVSLLAVAVILLGLALYKQIQETADLNRKLNNLSFEVSGLKPDPFARQRARELADLERNLIANYADIAGEVAGNKAHLQTISKSLWHWYPVWERQTEAIRDTEDFVRQLATHVDFPPTTVIPRRLPPDPDHLDTP